MSFCPEHREREPIGDVAELLGVIRYERKTSATAPQSVTQDHYRDWAVSRAQESMRRGLQPQPKKPSVADDPEIGPMLRDGTLRFKPREASNLPMLNTGPVAKFPSRMADAVGEMVPDAVKKAPVPLGPFGWSTVGGVTRGTSDLLLGTGHDAANMYAQAVNLPLLLAPGARAAGVAGKAAGQAMRRGLQAVARDGIVQATKDAMAAARRALPARKALQPLQPKHAPAVAAEIRAAEAATKQATAARAKPTWGQRAGKAFNLTWQVPLAIQGAQHLAGWSSSLADMVKAAFAGAMRSDPKLLPPPEANNIRQANGAAPGNDASGNALPGVKPDVPFNAESAPGIGALNALGNDADLNELRAEYAGLKRKVRILQERGLPLDAGMRPREIERWSDLNSPANRTEGGVSIFEGRR